MLKQLLYRLICVSGIILSINTDVEAGIYSYPAARIFTSGSPVLVGANTTAQIPLPYTDPSFADYSVVDKITLGVDHMNMTYITTPGDIVVTLKLDQWNSAGVLSTSYPVLTLKYQPFNPTFPYVDKSVFKFNNAYKMTVTIQSITVAGSSTTTLPANLYIDADILLERYTTFATATSPISIAAPVVTDLDCDGINDEIQLNWAPTVGVEEYELEWTFVNDYPTTSGGTYIVPGALNYDFKHNSTRVSVSNASYTISLIFEHGYLLYRVRGIGRDIANPTKRVVGYWSVTADNGIVGTVSSRYPITQEHESNKNWQYSTTFAEEGKKKEVISYFDGSLHNRQSVTKVNSDNNTIVGETIYDHQGRPAINVLPVPVKSPVCGAFESSIKYYPQFNKVNSTTGYSRADFDVDVSSSDTCNPFIKGMDASSGASNYYSGSNPNKTGSQAFVPDAELYPFSQIEYTPDNTGRIRRQGGVGKEFQLDKNHATKFYYGWPQQPQLDRLFGSEVGDAAHYKKNLVVDANGQVSITYLDQEGRTIATSLAGDAPKDATNTVTVLEALPSMPAPQPLVVDMFAEDANGKSSVNVVNVQEDGIEFVSQLLVAYQSDYEFTYDISIDKMTDPCLKSTVCVNCVYDLEIKIVDDCGRTVTPITGANPNIKNIGRFTTDGSGTLTGFNLDCTIPSLYTKTEVVKVNLPIGNYTVIKKLTVNKAAKDFYVASYLDRTYTPTETYTNLTPGCIRTYQSFLDTALAHLDTADCNISCTTCVASLKKGYATIDEARDAWVAAGNGTELDFDYLLEECTAPCRETSVCESNYQMMLMDVSPDGQYAEFQTKPNGDAPDITLSVLNTTNLLPRTTITGGIEGHWRKPRIKISGTEYNVYIDEHGTRTQIPIALIGALGALGTTYTPNVVSSSQVFYNSTTDSYYTYPENLASVNDFVAKWNDNWAKSLVMYHPEYPYYESCLDYNTKYTGVLTSDTFDSLLVHTTTYAQAYAQGLVANSVAGTTTASSMILFNVSNPIQDPFLFNSAFSTYASALQTKMSLYSGTTSMAAMAAIAARCGTSYGTLPVAATCDDFGCNLLGSTVLDSEWNIFKNMYLAEKQKLQKQRDDLYARTNNGFNECIGNTSYNPFSCGMGLIGGSYSGSPFFVINQPCGYSRYFYYRNKKKRFNPQTNTTPPSENETDYQAYLQTGQYPMALDLEYLLNALAANTKIASTTPVNLQYYPEFTQDMYVACGGVLSAAFTPFSWTATSTGSPTLSATISFLGLSNTFTLTKPASITNWNDMIGINDLKYTSTAGSIYYFSAVAVLANPSGGTVDPYIYIPITGSSTLNIGPGTYTFTEQCTPNDLATDLSILWSALAANSELSLATTVVLNASSTKYQAFITPAIKSILGTTSNNLHWKFIGGSTYELTDAAVPAKRLRIVFTGGTSGLTTVRSFINIKNNSTIGVNGFDVTGLDASGNPLPLMSGNVTLVVGMSTLVPMGECGLPDPAVCEGDEYQLREDLEELLSGVMLSQPFNYNPDLAANPLYTTLLQSYVGTSTQVSTTKYDYFTLNSANDYKEQILFNVLCKCHVNLWHKGVGSNIIKFENLTALGPLTPYGPVASDNNQYQFYLYATYLTGGSTISHDTIYGESCFPLKKCNSTTSYDTIISPEVPYVNPCILYELNIAHVNAENQYNQYIDSLTTYIADRYNSHCLGALENFSAAYNDKEYHFTLYYYDQAGNLVKTVPPEGVQLVTNPADFVTIKNDRTYNRHDFFTTHQMVSTYEYNSLNQLIRQSMPDHDMMPIWEFALPNGLDSRLKVTATQFVNSTKGYLSGYIDFTTPTTFKRGYLYTTDDGGVTWKKMNDMVAADIKKVQMIPASLTGYAVANYGIVLKTIDGGNTWDLFPTPATTTLNDLYFTTTSAGVVVGDNNTVYKTTTGGTSWTAVTSGLAASLNITGITFDGVYYWITANTSTLDGKIYRSTTALTSWTASTAIQTTDVLKVQLFSTTTEGYAIGTDGNLLKTTTSGTTWQTIAAGINSGFKDIYFKTPPSGTALEGVAIIDSIPGYGLIWKTNDGGVTWTLLSAHDGSYYNSFCFYQNDKGYAVGNKKIKRIVMTGGIGLVNLPLPSSFTSPFTSVYFSDGNNGWITNSTQAFFINNATATTPVWSAAISHGSAFPFKKVFFSTANNSGLALNTAGKLYKITPSGSTYVYTLLTSTTENFIDMDDNATLVYAFNKAVTTGNVRSIAKTAIAGVTNVTSFTTLTGALATGASISCMDAHPTAASIYIGGSGSLLYKGATTGTTVAWTAYTNTVMPTALYGIRASGSGASTSHVYAVGKDGTLIQTVNSGALWKTLPTNTTTQFNSIRFNKTETSAVAACLGLITGNNGLLIKEDITAAGVLTATTIPLTVSSTLNDVAISTLSPYRSYVVGSAGTMVYIPTLVTPVPSLSVPQPSQTFSGVYFKHNATTITNEVYAVGTNASIYDYNATSGAKINGVFTPGLNDVSFSSALDGYTVGEKNTIRYTNNGGVTWQYVLRPTSALLMNGVAAYAPGKAIIVGTGGYKADVSNTTVTNGLLGSAIFYDIALQGNTGFMVGVSTAYRGTYSGSTWTWVSVPPPASTLRAIHMFRNGTCIVAGDAGKVYCYNNSSTWVAQSTGVGTANLKDIFFHDDRNGYVVGDAGAIFKLKTSADIFTYTGASGSSWAAALLTGPNGVTTPSQVNIVTIDFPSRYQGFLGGNFTVGTPINYARLVTDEGGLFSTRFWYDRLGRMVVSQNTKQYNSIPAKYSYTKYDNLGRISEVGEKTENSTGSTIFPAIFGEYVNGQFNSNVIKDASLNSWLRVSNGPRKEVTHTFYDDVIPASSFGFTQSNLRKRVSSVTYEEVDDSTALTYQSASHYSYDIHGNVKSLWQENKQIPISGQTTKRIDYEYDLISGKVNVVRFQDGQPDAFYHFYEYDADNRVVAVYTSTYPQSGAIINGRSVLDNSLWTREAKYIYYAHGPLARIETGEATNQLQGTDYAYTLQGWVKGVNSNLLTASVDMGGDGSAAAGGHLKTAKDAFGYSLDYFQGDYAAIDASKWTSTARFESVTAGSDLMAARYDLYNGNITAMVTTITEPKVYTSAPNEFPNILPQATSYKYDQLNRIKSMQAYTNVSTSTNTWQSGSTYAGRYNNTFTYDANGNIINQLRKDEVGATIDNLTYNYYNVTGKKQQNRLYLVDDAVTSTAYTDDIDDQGTFNNIPTTVNDGVTNNYKYDEIGNLIKDNQEEILKIEWTVYGKIKKIIRTSASVKPDLEFKYDASGNRIAKIVKPDGSSLENGGADNPTLWATTYYARDAQGNILSTYKLVSPSGVSSLKVIERNMFGNSRLGSENTQIELISPLPTANPYIRTLGNKYYEGSNHLGNVLAVFTDKGIPRDDNSDGIVDYFQLEVIASTDYFPGHSIMQNRSFNSNAYRYGGADGQERDDEITGVVGSHYTAEYWEYDSRLVRRWNIDPVVKPNESSYLSYGANPIWNIDIKGDDWYKNNKTGKVVWIETQRGRDIEGYTYLGEHRYWNNFFTKGHYVYFNIFGRGNELWLADQYMFGSDDGANMGGVTFEQGKKIMAGTVGVILSGGTLFLAEGAVAGGITVISTAEKVKTGLAIFNLGTSVDDILSNKNGESFLESQLKDSPNAKKMYNSIKLAASLYSRSASLVEGLTTKGPESIMAFTDFLKGYYDVIDGAFSLKKGFDEQKVMKDFQTKNKKKK